MHRTFTSLNITGMTKSEAITFFGSAAKLAAALNIGRSAVTNWGEKIPAGRQYELELLTGGKLRADRTEIAQSRIEILTDEARARRLSRAESLELRALLREQRSA